MGYWLEFAYSVKYKKNLESTHIALLYRASRERGGASEDSPSFVGTTRLMSLHVFIIAGSNHIHFIW